MSNEEMIKAIEDKNITASLIEELVKFQSRFDPYGVLDYFGDISKKSNRAKMRKEIRYTLKTSPECIIRDLKEDMESA